MSPHKTRGGFTLLELIIALTVIMIVTGGVFLAFRQSDRQALEHASLQLQADIRYIQRRAIAEGRRFEISLERRENRYRILGLTRSEDIHVYFQNGVRLHALTTNTGSVGSIVIGFLPRGTASRALTIELRTERYSQRLTIVPSGGRVDIKDIVPLIN